MDKAIVLGGAGFIGSHLVERLVREKYQVSVIDDFSVGKESKLLMGADITVKDVRDISPRDWADRLEHDAPSRIYFLPAVCNSCDLVRFPYDSYDVTVRGLSNLLGGIRLVGPMMGTTLIYFSSSEVYGNDTNADDEYAKSLTLHFNSRSGYDVGKMAGEVMLDTAVHQFPLLDARIVRPFNVYGTYEYREGAVIKLMQQSMAGEPMTVYGEGFASRTYTHVDDFIDGLELVVKRGNVVGAYNLSTEEAHTVNDLADMIGDITGNHKVIHIPHPYDEVDERAANIAKAKYIGFEPKVSLRRGLEDVYRWMNTAPKFKMSYYTPEEERVDAVQ